VIILVSKKTKAVAAEIQETVVVVDQVYWISSSKQPGSGGRGGFGGGSSGGGFGGGFSGGFGGGGFS
jgi:uncharacterized membrane protein YgcG